MNTFHATSCRNSTELFSSLLPQLDLLGEPSPKLAGGANHITKNKVSGHHQPQLISLIRGSQRGEHRPHSQLPLSQ